MTRRGVGMGMIVQMVLWAALIILAGYLIYQGIVKAGAGPLPGEGLVAAPSILFVRNHRNV